MSEQESIVGGGQIHGKQEKWDAMLRELGTIPYRRMLYGEWLRDECEECHTTEQVTKFVDVSGKTKQPIYLCDKCFYAGLGPKHLREWMPEDK